MGSNNFVFELNNVGFSYGGVSSVLSDVSFSVSTGQRVALIGDNGAGKTTLLHLLVGLIKADRGAIYAFGQPVVSEADFRAVRLRAGLIFQYPDDQLFCSTVIEDVVFGPLNMGWSVERAQQAAAAALERVGLKDMSQAVTHRLSYGEKRLVSLASVLAMEPEVLLLDEPLNGLDRSNRQRVTEILSSLDIGYLIVSHEQQFLNKLCNRFLLIEGGKLREVDCC